MEERTFRQLLAASVKSGASDVHLRVGMPPVIRLNGKLLEVKAPAMSSEDLERITSYLCEGMIPAPPELHQLRELDLSYHLPEHGRFRVSVFRAKNELALVLRVIPDGVPTISGLGLPDVITKLCEHSSGLILVTGATGAGKSSTLAAMVDCINRTSKQHILTIEDPIEYEHQNQLARITQREIGSDSDNFNNALRSALRQDPDTIMVGEMRDLETVEVALQAAETGHLVLSSLHTTDAATTITRLVELYPKDAADSVRARLSESVRAVISQRLLPKSDGKGRVAALEVLTMTQTVQKMIRDDKMEALSDYLTSNTDVYGTQTFDQHLLKLCRDGTITEATACGAATRPRDFERNLHFD